MVAKKGEPQTNRPLLRPIICICNDLYASSLTKLRQHARIVRFSRPQDLHVVRRLREICEREDLKADGRGLATLVGAAQGDFRGCLNTLRVPWTHFSMFKFASRLIRYAQVILVFALPDGTLPSNAISLTHFPRPGSVTFCSSYYRLHRFIVLVQRRYLQIAHRSCPEYMSNVSSIL